MTNFWRAKKQGYIEKTRKGMDPKPNTQSADFLISGTSRGCDLGCSYCVLEGTEILTPKGTVPVEQIQDEDLITTYDSYSGQLLSTHIDRTSCREVEELIELQVDGGSIVVSLEHPVLTENRAWVKAKDLTCDDVVLCDANALRQHHSIEQI